MALLGSETRYIKKYRKTDRTFQRAWLISMLATIQLKQIYQLNVPVAPSFTQAEQLPFNQVLQ